MNILKGETTAEVLKNLTGMGAYSIAVGEMNFFVDNRKVVDELIKALNWEPEIENLQTGGEGILNVVVINEELNDHYIFKKGKYKFTSKFFCIGLAGEMFTNIVNMFKLPTKYDKKLLGNSEFAIEFNYREIAPNMGFGVLRTANNILLTHKKGESLLSSTARMANLIGDEGIKGIDTYQLNFENIIITNYLDSMHAHDLASKIDKQEMCANFLACMASCGQAGEDPKMIASSIKKYRTAIEELYGMPIADIYRFSLANNEDFLEVIQLASE